MGYLLRATNLWGYADLVRELGGDPVALLAAHGIRAGIEHEEDAFVPVASFTQLLEDTAADLDCPDFGLRVSTWQGLGILGPVAVIARNSQTVRGAFEAMARYLFVHSPALLLTPAAPGDPGTDGAAGEMAFSFRIDEPGTPYPTQAYELSLANGARILQFLGGPDCLPSRVSFLHRRQGPPASYAQTFGNAEVGFEQDWCGVALPEALAERRIDNADPETRRVVAQYLETQFVAGETGLAVRVADLIRRLLPTGHSDAEAVAELLRLHPRTLQRRLSEEGTRFADLLEAERRNQATRLLAKRGLQLGQVAGLLGYSEQSAFNRAFRRWFGTSPGRYRAGLGGS